MKRNLLLLMFVTLILIVGAKDYVIPLWELPDIYSKTSLSYLKYNKEVKFKLINKKQAKTYNHAFTSKKAFDESLNEYLVGTTTDKRLLRYTTQDSYIDFKVAGFIDIRDVENDTYYFTGWGMDIKANINNKILLHTDWWKGHYSGATEIALNDYIVDSWHNHDIGEKNISNIDNLKGSLSYVTDHATVSVGRGGFVVGNNVSGSIILNNKSDDYAYLSAKYTMGDFSYSVMQGTINIDPSDAAYELEIVDKYISMHKIDWKFNHIKLFLGEEIVYGNRSFDSNYVLPIGFWRINEHLQYDRDNVLIFAGGSFKVNKSVLYSNIVLDELRKKEIFGNWWGNKWAIQAGLSHNLNIGMKNDMTVTGELTIVRPWIYSHKYYWNYLSHSGETLGYPNGSNLINYCIEINLPINRVGSLDINYNLNRQGSLANDYTWNYADNVPGDREDYKTSLLQGHITNTSELTAVYSLEYLSHHFVKFAVNYKVDSDNIEETTLSCSYMTRF